MENDAAQTPAFTASMLEALDVAVDRVIKLPIDELQRLQMIGKVVAAQIRVACTTVTNAVAANTFQTNKISGAHNGNTNSAIAQQMMQTGEFRFTGEV